MQAVVRSRKTDILAAAQREFATAGFAGARIDRIAAAAAVNKQLLFHYFSSKEGLFTAALGQLLDHLPVAPRPTDSPLEQVRHFVRDLLAAVRAVPGMVGLVASARSNRDFPADAGALVSRWKGRQVARLTAALEDGQRRGYFRDDIEPAAVAAVALAAVLGAVAVDGGADAERRFDAHLDQLLVDHCAWR